MGPRNGPGGGVETSPLCRYVSPISAMGVLFSIAPIFLLALIFFDLSGCWERVLWNPWLTSRLPQTIPFFNRVYLPATSPPGTRLVERP